MYFSFKPNNNNEERKMKEFSAGEDTIGHCLIMNVFIRVRVRPTPQAQFDDDLLPFLTVDYITSSKSSRVLPVLRCSTSATMNSSLGGGT